MNYIESLRRPVRYIPAVLATLLINAWLIYALLHGNLFPFAAPGHLIKVSIFPDAKRPSPDRGWNARGARVIPPLPTKH